MVEGPMENPDVLPVSGAGAPDEEDAAYMSATKNSRRAKSVIERPLHSLSAKPSVNTRSTS